MLISGQRSTLYANCKTWTNTAFSCLINLNIRMCIICIICMDSDGSNSTVSKMLMLQCTHTSDICSKTYWSSKTSLFADKDTTVVFSILWYLVVILWICVCGLDCNDLVDTRLTLSLMQWIDLQIMTCIVNLKSVVWWNNHMHQFQMFLQCRYSCLCIGILSLCHFSISYSTRHWLWTVCYF